MMFHRTLKAVFGLSLIATMAAGCDGSTGPSGPALRDLQVNLTSMDPHVGQRLEFRVVTDSDDLVGMAVVDSLVAPSLSFKMPSILPDGSGRLDFFADLNKNGIYDAPPTDHAWRRTLASSGGLVVDFTHNTSFTDISTPAYTEHAGDFTINITGMTPHLGNQFELRIIVASTGQTVGYYRMAEIPSAAFSFSIPGIIDADTEYRLDLYADLNGDGNYDAPPVDHAWRVMQTSSGGGGGTVALTVNFAHNMSFTDIHW